MVDGNEETRKIQELTQAHDDAKAHWNADYAKLKGQTLRRQREELTLLSEGLHALRCNPPKVHVMIDHVERVIDGLKRDMAR